MRSPLHTGVLYDLVALGMTGYVGARYEVAFVGAHEVQPVPGMLFVSTHQSDDDVPVLSSRLYFGARLWRRSVTRPGFVVRNDLFAPGFFAGYPSRLPTPLRRLLWRVNVGPVLRRSLACLPVRSATQMHLSEALEDVPELPLDRMPAQIAAELHRRALKLRVSAPANAGDVLRAEYGHELWQWVTRHEFSPPELDGVWARRAVEATADFRRIVDAVRRGASLIIFPEGIPSPDGRIGPLRPGLERLARRGRPSGLQPFALAYDPLVEGRTRVVVATRPPLAPPFDDRVGDAMLHELRRTMPLVGGQVLAGLAVRLARVPKPDEALDELERALEVARRSDRPVDPRLETGDLREPVEGALARLRRRGLEHAEVRRLALTHESAAMLAA